MEDTKRKSLEEVHGSVDTTAKRSTWGKILAFFGPAYLISVGYMDPGNWATDIAGGSRYGYSLIWVLLMSNLMALLLQSFSARLGIVAGRDLAQASRESYPRGVNYVLYFLAEIAIAACDLAEVLGMAIGLKLLFGLPIIWGVTIAIFDTILLLFLQRLGMRKMELFIISLVAIIGMSFFVELIFAKPDGMGILSGFVPQMPDKAALYIAIGIIGATVMPHNLYLHSALVQTRKIARDPASIRRALKFTNIDSAIALNMAFLVNAAILILSAAVFYKNELYEIADIEDAHKLLQPLLGSTWAPILFAVALIAAGQSSTITGTLAGQIVMEGYLHIRLPMWLRRLVTRLLAVMPAYFAILYYGDESAGELLIFSQVVLSLQLGFAIIPLIHFVSDKFRMGEFVVKTRTRIIAWLFASVILTFNIMLVAEFLWQWIQPGSPVPFIVKIILVIITIGLALLLLYIIFMPAIQKMKHKAAKLPHGEAKVLGTLEKQVYNKIAITVDFSKTDIIAIEHAVAQGGNHASYLLIHIVETPNALLKEKEVGDLEAKIDVESIKDYVKMLQVKGFKVAYELGYGRRSKAIAEIVNKYEADLLVMGSHGHKGLKDIIFGETIDDVRHRIKVPLLAVK